MKKYFLNKMSTGKRLAKRSIIGTRVCAPGADGIWYSGTIQGVKTPPSANQKDNTNCINLTPHTRYSVRFDSKQDISRRGLAREFRESELIGPGFKTIMDVRLKPGQKVFLTYNGRESAGEVVQHDDLKDEVTVKIVPVGQEVCKQAGDQPPPTNAPIELTKRLEEVRLLESRRSPRLADQEKDTDFARLADMAGDRRRQSHSIDVPFSLTQQNGSRKRRPSYSQDDREYYSINDEDPTDECNAALVLMSLSCSPNSSAPGWETILGTSSGSSSTSWSTGSTSPPLSEDGHSTPPNNNSNNTSNSNNTNQGNNNTSSKSNSNSNNNGTTNAIVIRGPRTTSFSNSDEGIGMDYNEDLPRKRRVSLNHKNFISTHKPANRSTNAPGRVVVSSTRPVLRLRPTSETHIWAPRKPEEDSDEEDFFFTEIEDETDSGSGHQHHSSNHSHSHHHHNHSNSNHHSHSHSSSSSSSSNAGSARHPPSPPTLSHRDMARPPHEDPEYQRQIVGNYRQGLLSMSSAAAAVVQQQQQQQQHLVHHQQQQHQHHQQQIHQQLNAAIKPPLPATAGGAAAGQQFHQSLNNNNNNNNGTGSGSVIGSNGSGSNGSASIHTSPLIHHNYTWSQVSPTSPQKHVRLSPRPSASYPYPSPNYSNQIAQQQQQQQQHHYQAQHSLGQIQLSPGGSTTAVSSYHQQQSSSSSAASSLISSSSSGSGSLNGFVAPGTSPGANRSPLSPNRRTRGENKKCRKVYGMDHKEQWCTQCKWKKACSRFGD